MTKILLILSLVGLVAAATSSRAAASADDEFVALAKGYIDQLMAMYPEWATQLGDHRYDGRLTDMSPAAIAERTKTDRATLEKLHAIDASSLSVVNRVDYQILESNIERMIFENEELRAYQWNPLTYNMGGAIYALIARGFAPLNQRMESVKSRLEAIPAYLEQAESNLKDPPKIHTETAMLQNNGVISLIRDDLQPFVEKAGMVDEMRKPRADAIAALEAYGKWLDSDLLPRSNGDFRLGDALWRKKLHFSLQSDLSKEEILSRAASDLDATQQRMYETALPLYKKYFPDDRDPSHLQDSAHVCKAVLDELAKQHPTNETIVPLARKTLAAAVDFVKAHRLVTVPDEPVKLIVMPEFQRGVAVAYCDAPGPMDKNLSTFFAISPTPDDWSKDRVESFFREYNDYMLYDLTVHEAMPGHYLQLAHSNAFHAPTMVRAIFTSGPFVEGWAVYAERFMAEEGFGGPEVRMEQLKMRLRVIINAIIDQKIHTGGMTKDEAMKMMMEEGYQEEGEAAGKWTRACLTSTQLSTYFVGSAEVEDIRAAYEKEHPGKVDLQKLHDTMLSFGSPPPRYVRELMGL